MSDSSSNISRPRFGGGGRLYREEGAPVAAAMMDMAREVIEEERVAELMKPDSAPPWADQPEPEPERKVEPKRRRKSEPERETTVENPPPMKVGKIEEPKKPKPPFDRREAASTGLELVGIGLLITTGFLITVWLGTLIAGLSLVLLGVATSNNYRG
jgi:hypothetical protein